MGKYTIAEVIDFFRAEFRHYLYYKYENKSFLKQHIKEQIDFRINVMMDKKCFFDGQCKVCGCKTTNLQFTNASCKGNCYPPLVDEITWSQFKEYKGTITDDHAHIRWHNKNYGITLFEKKHKNLIEKEELYVG